MNKIYFLIGASGAGKTTAAKVLENKRTDIYFYYPDQEQEIPSMEEMVKQYGSTSTWQQIKTIERVKDVKEKNLHTKPVLIDTQSRFDFIKEACDKNGIENYQVILFDCQDSIRNQRLHVRGQPELINEKMDGWAKFLREDCQKHGCAIVDTSNLTVEVMTNSLEKALK